MLGCGHCPRCAAGRGHVCADRREVGIMGWPGGLGASAGLAPAIEYYATGRVDSAPVIGVTVGLEQAAEALAGKISTGPGTKIHVDSCG